MSIRFHCFGIGEGVSTDLIKGLANNGNGQYFFINDSQEISSKVISCLNMNSLPYLQIKEI